MLKLILLIVVIGVIPVAPIHGQTTSDGPNPQQIAAAVTSALPQGPSSIAVMFRGSIGKGALNMDGDAYELISKKKMPEGSAGEWSVELARLTGRTRAEMAIPAAIAIAATRSLWAGDLLKVDSAEQYLAVLKELQRRDVTKWYDAFTRFQEPFYPAVPILILQGISMPGSSLTQQQLLARGLERLNALPPDVVSRLSEIAMVSALDSAVALLRVDSLFSGASFNRQRFDRAMPLVKRKAAGLNLGGAQITVLYDSTRRVDGEVLATALTSRGGRVDAREVDARSASHHSGKMYYGTVAEADRAWNVARAISAIESVTPMKDDLRPEDSGKLFIWVLK